MNNNLTFTLDQKAVIERELRSVNEAVGTLLHWVEGNNLNDEMKETLPSLIDGHMKKVKEIVGWTGEEPEYLKEMSKSINEDLHKQIRTLENAVRNQNSFSGIGATTKVLFDKIESWWDIEGFHYISEKSLTPNGRVSLKLGFMLDSFSSRYSETPVTDKEKLITKREQLMLKGFQFTPKKRGYGFDLIDNDQNKKLLIGMVKESFPSAEVYEVKNHLRRTNNSADDYFIIRYLDVMIDDLSDIENLEIVEKTFLYDEEAY